MRVLFGLGFLLIGLVALATPAGAHNALEQVDPPDGTTVSKGASITFRFSADVPLETMSVEVIDASSMRIALVGLRHGVYLYNGTLTSPILGEAFRLPYKDLDILLAAF